MASLKAVSEPNTELGSALKTNFDVDFVIDYRFSTSDKEQAEAQFVKLIESVHDVGLTTEVRNGDNFGLLIFVKASKERLRSEVYRSRVQDWLYGVRITAPAKDMHEAFEVEPVTEAERLRLVYLLITKSKIEGGAGITPKRGEWMVVESIFPLHDHAFNKAWITEITTKYLLTTKDLEDIKNRFGERIGFYFAFLQSYFKFLVFPAAFGFCAWVLLGEYSPIYAIVNGIWCIVYTEYWKKQETDLAVQWGVRGVSKIQRKRVDFKPDSEITDPITGEQIKFYSPVKRLSRQLLQIPFALCATVLLGSLIASCFAIEIFISEVYDGPFKTYLTFLPTVILTVFLPTLTVLLNGIASKLTALENYQIVAAHEAAMVQKIFVLNFITSYVPIFLTAFVYVPFAQVIVPHLDILQMAVKPFAENDEQMTVSTAGFQIDPDRLKKQIIYQNVTAQLVNFAVEVIIPYAKRMVFRKYKEIQADRTTRRRGSYSPEMDHPEEIEFLTRVRDEAELALYDVATDFREMVIQFGYLSLFSVVWPLTGLSFLINNWVELRGDAVKIALEAQRPVPWRADSIGPWIEALGFLSWLGSLSTAALVYIFSGDGVGPDGTPSNMTGWGLLLTMFFSEHIYLTLRSGIRLALSKIDSPGLQRERKERFAVRKQYLEGMKSQEETEKATQGGISQSEKISRSTLEENARESTLRGRGTVEERFWARQRGQGETIAMGKIYINKTMLTFGSGESKKEL
ncbi:hypothetical protein sscle_02g021070 [Sclerotinia sclerotiorum 1980 UF-70]|uniref:Plasma membrane channel protein n=1 Tax=Sclerotinia sclerotiorum (strain ATCC 18683 / 1980 / Ss-1) TaxID=665079 RepID=A0A1D9PXB5_SCLS1|nr:hypothetical protein sscle_02g021070 [Sclerotinia sclerotiorum 1980 UF-70]